jgi:glycogen synthase
MAKGNKKLRIAMAAWEIGRAGSGFGTKIGGLGAVLEELPQELIKAADKQGIQIEIEILSPCFAHYDKTKMKKLDLPLPVTIDGNTFEYEAYEHTFRDGQKAIYFWDEWQLNWTWANSVYPGDPHMALKLYASVCQAMAGYIRQNDFNTVHLHDYHVGLVPFYLGDDYLKNVPIHLTIHNATYQGNTPIVGGGYASIDRIGLSGEKLFHKYFDFFDYLNLLKASMLKVHENGGKITTVSGDLEGTWGYVAELKENQATVWAKAYMQKNAPPGKVFLPNGHLDLFEKLPIAGITNGMSDINRPENMPELKGSKLREKFGNADHLFRNPITREEMLNGDHNFDVNSLDVKARLKRLLHLEVFGSELAWDPILFTVVGRLVQQKNLGLVAEIIERTLNYDSGAKFIVLASAPKEDTAGQFIESRFFQVAARYPGRVYFSNEFNIPLSKLILAGGDFCLIPSRFEPCGLVDYEAALVGNVPICRATGGLVKVRHCGYLYDWLDISDWYGEANAFFQKIREAIDTYRHNPWRHKEMMRAAMDIDANWDRSAGQYLELYRYGLLAKRWQAGRKELIGKFVGSLKNDRELFARFFSPGRQEYGDKFDWELKAAL